MDLLHKKCVPCEVKVPPFTIEQIAAHLGLLTLSWEVEQNTKLFKQFIFADFKTAMFFVNKVATLSEEEGHHPDIAVHYNKVGIELSTHFIGGLSENDFILARKIEHLV